MPEPRSPGPEGPETHSEQERPPASTGRGRLLRAAIEPSRRQVVVALVLALVGYGVVVQVRSADIDTGYDSLRQQDLIDVLNGLAGTSQRAQGEITRLTRTRDELQNANSARRAALEQARTEVDTLSVLAGTVPVTGPGIRITVTEETGTVRLSSMLDLVQELRVVGAEAIQVNGEVRVVAQTAVEDVDGGLLVGGTLVESPYVIDVIGDQGVLAGAIEFALGPRAQLEDDGASVQVEQLASVDIESVTEQDEPDLAAPDRGQ